MTTLLPTSQSTGVETYEDMFKEITRKLYGDEATAHGLYPHNTQVAQLAPGAPTAPPDGGERSFTTLTQIGYETSSSVRAGNQPTASATSQQQSTAFGLAALMQNGFPPPAAILNPVNFPNASKTPTNISIPSSDERWQSHQQAAHQVSEESWNGGKHASSSTSGYSGKSFKKPKTEPQDATSPTGLNIPSTADRTGKGGSNYGTSASSVTASGSGVIKRYSCTSCPYTTDRRDLFTRHENIHKDEKPFQCYACLKPFNRADHVKKHFLRMHRELEYDIAKTRRHQPAGSAATSSKSAYYGNGGSSQAVNLGTTVNSAAAMSLAQMQLNIPSGSSTFGSGASSAAQTLSAPAHSLESSSSIFNGAHSGQLLQLQNHHHHQQQQQQQQQQQSQQHHHNNHQHQQQVHSSLQASISIKQEKSSGSGSNVLNFNTSTGSSSAVGLTDEKPFVKKIKGEKKFACTYCPWAGADNWGLKRHLNTHTKPYVCLLCDYKAARSERLATHVLKVHNKKACSKCNFFAEDQAHLDSHLQEAHPHDMSKAGKGAGSAGGGSSSNGSSGGNCGNAGTHHAAASAGSNGNVLRNLGNAFTSNNLPTNIPTSGNGFGNGASNGHYPSANVHHATPGNVLTNSNAANLIDTINQHVLATAGQNGGTTSLQQQQQQQWVAMRPHRKRGPELLYSYLEADGSDSGDYARLLHMQTVGRNKASVTQDFHNAGGGDKGGMIGAGAGDSSSAATPYSFSMGTIERQKRKQQSGSGGSSSVGQGKATDNVNLSLASLFGGDQLSFLQLLATAAVAHQQMQLHSSQQTYGHHQQLQKKQQHHQSQPKPYKAADHPVGASHGVRYGSMVSSPPATSTQQQARTASTSTGIIGSSTISSSGSNSTNGTNGTIVPINTKHLLAPEQPLALDTGSYKKRRTNASSSDKENYIHRNRTGEQQHDQQQQQQHHSQQQQQQQQQQYNGSTVGGHIANGGNGPNLPVEKHYPHAGGKNGHTHHNHHHNNNNSHTNNKNINDIFDKVYKKPQNSFGTSKQSIQQHAPPAAHSLNSLILRTAPPSAVEEDNRRSAILRKTIEQQAENFSLVEFLKNHTEVSISTVGAKGTESPSVTVPDPVGPLGEEAKENSTDSDLLKRKQDSERNPRKQNQPRRVEETGEGEPLAEDATDGQHETVASSQSENDDQDESPEGATNNELPVVAHGRRNTRLADIRDKHMIKLITNRRCCRICQNKGLLDHLDNSHYHSKISLILHTHWRHRPGSETVQPKIQCGQCGCQFDQRYKLILHQRLTKHAGMLVKRQKKKKPTRRGSKLCKKLSEETKMAIANGDTNGSGKKRHDADANRAAGVGKRKQRKRKARSRCFTTRRRK
ncbi:protein charlatan [Anopheles nili]|uniref:protein charlatan n=1 Tax=Anopheles nili TaxID=185578 RepID=UPI00237A2476|nr:protein charlatan [Anopheles nili]